MIKVENIEVWGFEHAVRGMRNPLNSWDRSDSYPAVDCGKCGRIEREGICHPKEHDCTPYYCYEIGENDLTLMRKLFAAGHPHRKYLRQIFVAMDITAPLYWWKEFDTYKVGTTANSCSWTISYRKLCSPKTISLLCLTPRKSRKQSSSVILSGIRRSWQR